MMNDGMSWQRIGIAVLMVVLLILPVAPAPAQAQDADAIGSISGMVTAADGSTPIALAAVYVYDYASGENLGLAFTAPDGRYSVDYLLPGTYAVRAVSVGSVAQYADGALTLQDAPPITVDAGESAAVDFALPPAGFFAGAVTRDDGVTPLARAVVYAYDAATGTEAGWAETRADGTFTLSVPTGAYRLTAYQFDYQARSYTSDPSSDQPETLTIQAGQTIDGIDFPLAEIGVLSGAVYLPDGISPAAGVTVFVYDSQNAATHTYSTTTLANGTYSRPVLEGTYYVGTSNVSYGSVYYNQRLTLSVADAVTVPGNTQVGGITMRYFGLTGNSTLLATVALQGRPSKPDPRWSVPLAVTLTAEGAVTPIYAATVMSNENGVITLENIPPGSYTLRVKHAHTLAVSTPVTLVAGGNAVEVGTLCEGDANNDNVVNISDFSILAASFGRAMGQDGYDARADFNLDNVVTITDFSLLAANFGQQGAG